MIIQIRQGFAIYVPSTTCFCPYHVILRNQLNENVTGIEKEEICVKRWGSTEWSGVEAGLHWGCLYVWYNKHIQYIYIYFLFTCTRWCFTDFYVHLYLGNELIQLIFFEWAPTSDYIIYYTVYVYSRSSGIVTYLSNGQTSNFLGLHIP